MTTIGQQGESMFVGASSKNVPPQDHRLVQTLGRDNPILGNAVEILQKLVGFQSISRQSNLALIEYVQDYLAGFDIVSRLVFNEDRSRANLYATIGPGTRGGLCFSGHSDVVPVSGQPWSADPFTLIERDGKLYGRGSADMKGYIACVLACVPHFVAAVRDVPVHIAISYDEEIGCVGVRDLLAILAEDEAKPVACIIGEPTSMRVAVAHKGKHAYRCGVHGLAGHSSQPDKGVNAIEYAAELISHLRGIGRDIRRDGPFDAAFEPPYTTIQTGTVRGGVAVNVVPDQCVFDFEIRQLPNDDGARHAERLKAFAMAQLLDDMRSVYPEAAIDVTALSAYPGMQEESSDAAKRLKALCGHALGLADVGAHTLSFGTEGGLFQEIGIPTLVCGPGSIDQAHKADEFVAVEQLAQCCDFLRAVSDGLVT
jgi:acetylornithine deacetylase